MTAAASRPLLDFKLRPAANGDEAFLIKPWLQALRDEVTTRHIPDDVFFQGHGALVKRILFASSTRTVVACDAESPDHLYGFACGGPGVVHWVYVKGPFRGMGLGRALLEEIVSPQQLGKDTILCSHATHIFNERAKVARYRLVFNPYVLHGAAA